MDTVLIAPSTKLTAFTLPPVTMPTRLATAVPRRLSASALVPWEKLIVIWLKLSVPAPTWKVSVAVVARSCLLPKTVACAIRSISESAWFTSSPRASRADWSVAPTLAACRARSRTRCKMACTSPRAPSAVWMTLMPSCALRTAILKPPTWLRSFSLIERPAASSAARLIRKPDESFSRLLESCPSVTVRFRYELNAATF